MFLFQWLSFSIILKVLCIVLKNKIEILFFFLKVNSGNNNHRQRKRRLNVCKEKYTAFIGDTFFFSTLSYLERNIVNQQRRKKREIQKSQMFKFLFSYKRNQKRIFFYLQSKNLLPISLSSHNVDAYANKIQ